MQLSPAGSQSGKARKPKGLELMPTLVVTSSDLSPMGLSSPSLPTASLTPAFLQVRPDTLASLHRHKTPLVWSLYVERARDGRKLTVYVYSLSSTLTSDV